MMQEQSDAMKTRTSTTSTSTRIKKTHVAILVSAGMGHLIPSLELAKSLVSNHDLKVTIFVPNTSTSSSSSSSSESYLTSSALSSLIPTDIRDKELLNLVDLIPLHGHDHHAAVDYSNDDDDHHDLGSGLSKIIQGSLSSLRSILKGLRQQQQQQQFCPAPSVLITDMFGTDAFEIADDFNMSKYLFFTCNLTAFAFLAYLPKLDPKELKAKAQTNEPLRVPGLTKQVVVHDLGDTFSDPDSQDYVYMLQHARRFVEVSGVLVNTFQALEPQTHEALIMSHMHDDMPNVYTVGPITKSAAEEEEEEEGIRCLSWLDMQPPDSVLYVSFGSGGALSAEQVTELAWGLELSQQRFIWVVRKPCTAVASINTSTYLAASGGGGGGGGQHDDDDDLDLMSKFLPDEFLSRTRGVGMVILNWAPQVEILSHGSIGGFLSHCGWNSTLESIVNGIPLIPWPLFEEQHLNASMLSDDIKVAVRSPIQSARTNNKGVRTIVVGREEIQRMIRLVMEEEGGKILRRRAKQVKKTALGALGKDGSSYNSLSHLAEKWKTESLNSSGTRLNH